MYIGRFAPTPSGPLHYGSVVTAIASYLDAKAHQGKWLVKIDDIDQPRVAKGAENSILKSLELLGLEWDDKLSHQSERIEFYQYYLESLKENGHLYLCSCSRKTIHASGKNGLDGIIYNGACRNMGHTDSMKNAYRVKVNNSLLMIEDLVQGKIKQKLANDIGDFIVKRSDQIFAYQFAVVVDNYLDKLTHVCRGNDLINSLPRQRYLHQLLDFTFPISLHIPLASKHQKKLSKGHGDKISIKGNETASWVEALKFLGQPIDPEYASLSVKEIIPEAIKKWSVNFIPKSTSIEVVENIHT
jgi:glutamyl-Q tRNA(Asp) synthetase